VNSVKKNRKRKIKDYSKYDFLDMEYHGIFYKKGKIKIDTKRLSKTNWVCTHLIEKINAIPRNSAYFIPNRKTRYEYRCNIFSDRINELRSLWENELKHTVNTIKTPEQIGEQAFDLDISFGILDHGECETVRAMESFRRSREYDFLLSMIYAQYIHIIGSVMESVQIEVFEMEGCQMTFSGKKEIEKVTLEKFGIKIKDIQNYHLYERFYALWNFLKHNSKLSYEGTREIFPEILNETEFKNGSFSLKYLKLSEQTIIDVLNDLDLFFKCYCEVVFKENTEEASWNYDHYFLRELKIWKEGMENPLGIPPYT